MAPARGATTLLRVLAVLALAAGIAAWQQGWLEQAAPSGLAATAPASGELRRGSAFVTSPPVVEVPLEPTPVPTDDGGGQSLLAEGTGVSEFLDEELYDEPPPPEIPQVPVIEAPTQVAMALTPDPVSLTPASTPDALPAPEATPAAPKVFRVVEEHTVLTIDDLAAFEYKEPETRKAADGSLAAAVPESVRRWSGEKIAIHGYMMPIEVEGNEVKSFVLVNSQLACCFGVTPKMNEWVYVTMEEGKSARYLPDLPVLVWGTLKVEEELRRETVLSLYRLTSSRVDGPREWARAGWKF